MCFTLVESPEIKRALVVREVSDTDQKLVQRSGGCLFATMAEAEVFLETQRIFENGPAFARGVFSRKRVDGLRIYIAAHLGGGVG
jgi:hypothetical protein